MACNIFRRRELLDLNLITKAAPSITNLRWFGSSSDVEKKSFVQNDGRYVLSLDAEGEIKNLLIYLHSFGLLKHSCDLIRTIKLYCSLCAARVKIT
jgi:hypothetical protein